MPVHVRDGVSLLQACVRTKFVCGGVDFGRATVVTLQLFFFLLLLSRIDVQAMGERCVRSVGSGAVQVICFQFSVVYAFSTYSIGITVEGSPSDAFVKRM